MTCTAIINNDKKVSISIMKSQSIKNKEDQNTTSFNGQES